MKRMILVIAMLVFAAALTIGQKKTSIKQVEVTAQTTSKAPTTIDLTRKGSMYTLAPGVDYSRVHIRTSKGDMTVADLVKKSGKKVTGRLRVGATSDLRTQKLKLSRTAGAENYNCAGILCTCTGDEDCNNMFTKEACGDIAMCSDDGCWCFRL